MAVFANAAVFGGGGVYRMKADPMTRMIGKGPRQYVKYRIARPGPLTRAQKLADGRTAAWPEMKDPYLPESFDHEFHPGGNSLCYMAQVAHLLGAGQVYALGFTLQAGSTYFFGRENPVHRGPPIYDTDRALHWLSWYESQHPGRLKLLPGFAGPVYDVLQTETLDDYRVRLAEARPEPRGEGAPEPDAGQVLPRAP